MAALGALIRREPAVAAFTAVHVVVMAVLGTVWGRSFTWIYVPLLVASIAAVVIIDGRVGGLPRSDLWLLSIWALAHMSGGLLGDPSGGGGPMVGSTVRLTPKGLLVSVFSRRISLRAPSGEPALCEVNMPRPPALDTAAASSTVPTPVRPPRRWPGTPSAA